MLGRCNVYDQIKTMKEISKNGSNQEGKMVYTSKLFIIIVLILENENLIKKNTDTVINSDQPKYSAQANPDKHFSPPVDFLFQESLLFTSIPL